MNSKELTVLESFLSSRQNDQSSQMISKPQPTHRLNMRHRRMQAVMQNNKAEETSLSYSNVSVGNSMFDQKVAAPENKSIA